MWCGVAVGDVMSVYTSLSPGSRAGWSASSSVLEIIPTDLIEQHHSSQHQQNHLRTSSCWFRYFLFCEIVSSINIFLCSLSSFFVDNESWGRRDGKYFEEITNIDKKINTSRKCRNVEQLKIFFVRLTIPAGRI